MKKKLLLLAPAFLATSALASCGGNNKVRVIFNPDYEGAEVTFVEVEKGKTVTAPTEPAGYEGYDFAGWKVAPNDDSEDFNFETKITEDKVLYGSWVRHYEPFERDNFTNEIKSDQIKGKMEALILSQWNIPKKEGDVPSITMQNKHISLNGMGKFNGTVTENGIVFNSANEEKVVDGFWDIENKTARINYKHYENNLRDENSENYVKRTGSTSKDIVDWVLINDYMTGEKRRNSLDGMGLENFDVNTAFEMVLVNGENYDLDFELDGVNQIIENFVWNAAGTGYYPGDFGERNSRLKLEITGFNPDSSSFEPQEDSIMMAVSEFQLINGLKSSLKAKTNDDGVKTLSLEISGEVDYKDYYEFMNGNEYRKSGEDPIPVSNVLDLGGKVYIDAYVSIKDSFLSKWETTITYNNATIKEKKTGGRNVVLNGTTHNNYSLDLTQGGTANPNLDDYVIIP